MVKDVGFDDTVEELTANETEFTIDCRTCSANISPGTGVVVRKRWVGMLEIGNGNYLRVRE